MKLSKLAVPVICGSIFALSFVFNTFGSSVTPGSIDDPVVTKSYVDKLVSEISSQQYGGMEISEYQMEFIINEITSNLSGGVSVSAPAYAPVNLLEGQILIGEEGTEIILRSGNASAYTIGADGLADVTSGEDATNNNSIGRNHLLIVPRADGRGVRALSDSWFLVKGGYSVVR